MCRGAVGQPPVVLSAASTKNRALSQSVGSAPRSPLSVVHSVRLAYIHVYLNASNFIRWESMVISASSIYAIPSSSTNTSIFGQFSDDGGAISIRIVGMCHRSVPTTLFDHCTVTKTFFRNFSQSKLKDQRFFFFSTLRMYMYKITLKEHRNVSQKIRENYRDRTLRRKNIRLACTIVIRP